MNSFKNYSSLAVRLIVGLILAVDGFSKLDTALANITLIPIDVLGLPEWTTGVISFLEFISGIAIIFQVFPVPFSIAMMTLMGGVLVMMFKGGTTFNFGEMMSSLTNLEALRNTLVIPLVSFVLLIGVMLLKPTKSEKLERKQQRAGDNPQTAASSSTA